MQVPGAKSKTIFSGRANIWYDYEHSEERDQKKKAALVSRCDVQSLLLVSLPPLVVVPNRYIRMVYQKVGWLGFFELSYCSKKCAAKVVKIL